jgi:hypothetical protein
MGDGAIARPHRLFPNWALWVWGARGSVGVAATRSRNGPAGSVPCRREWSCGRGDEVTRTCTETPLAPGRRLGLGPLCDPQAGRRARLSGRLGVPSGDVKLCTRYRAAIARHCARQAHVQLTQDDYTSRIRSSRDARYRVDAQEYLHFARPPPQSSMSDHITSERSHDVRARPWTRGMRRPRAEVASMPN